jgi:hypothetical protein
MLTSFSLSYQVSVISYQDLGYQSVLSLIY